MRKKLTLMFVAFLAVAAFAATTVINALGGGKTEVVYALAEGDTFNSGQTVDVKNGNDVVATITYGEAEGADFKAAKADAHVDGFTAFTEGNGTNGNKAGGTFYTIVPKLDGSIDVAVVLNADKKFYIEEDGTALENYNGITEAEKYYGTYKFTVSAGKSYKVYCAGSKLGFYGFKFTYVSTAKVSNIASLNALDDGTPFIFKGTALVQALVKKGNATYCYIKDGIGSSLIYDQKSTLTADLAVGKTIEPGWSGKVSIYNGLFEVVPDAALSATEDAPIEPTFENATLADVKAENVNKIMKLTDVTIASVSGSDFTLKKNDATAVGYNQFAIKDLANGLVCSEMIGVVGIFKEAVQFQPISFVVGTPAPAPADVTISPAPGTDISAALAAATELCAAKNITINLTAGDPYTLTSSIPAAASVVINGAAGAVIDASKLNDAFINYSSVIGEKAKKDETTESAYTIVEEVTIKNVVINGLANSLINNASGAKTLFKAIDVNESVIEVSGSKNFFALGTAYANNLKIKNSTIWSKTTHTGFFFKADGKPADVNSKETSTWAVENSNLVNIAVGKKANNSNGGLKGKKTTTMILKNSILVNFASNAGNEVNGWLWGQNGGANAEYGNNTYWSALKDGQAVETWITKGAGDKTGTEIKAEPLFADAANGDFTLDYCLQKLMNCGDPRWNNTKLGASYLVGSKIAELKLTVGETVLEYPNTANVPANATVFIDVEKEGYAVKKFTTKPSNAIQVLTITENKKYAFAMPDKAVQVNATFMAVLKPEWITAIPNQKYTNQAIKPTVVLTDEYTKAVIPATEYTVDYTNNVEAGEATVTVKGKNNNYTGEVTAKFNIIRQELKNEWIAAIPNQAWTGEAVEPTVTVTDKIENKVIDPENYTVEFANNVDAGEATVTVKAKENNYYIGQATAKFNIIKVDEAKAEDGSSFWYRVIDEASKEATILHIEPASADVESFTIPATIDGYDIVAFEDIALSPAAVANVKDFYLPAVKGHAIAGITSEMLTDTRVYQHPSKVARIHVPLEVLGEYAQALDYFTNLYKVSAVKESAPRFWTLGCSVNVMLDAASDAKVYIVKAKDATSVEKVATGTKVIEAGNGVLIEGTAGQDYQVIAAPDAELMRVEVDYSENLLVAVTAPAHFGEGYYILKNGAFYAAGGDDDAVVPAGKAVLYLPTATAPILTISGEATGIKIANADDLKNAQIYDMNGRKVEGVPAQKGIYILNGKKVAIK